MAQNVQKAGVRPDMVLLCLTAAASATAAGSLLYLAGISLLMVLAGSLTALLRPLSGRTSGPAALLLTAALAGCWRQLLAAWAPARLAEMGPAWLFFAVLLFSGPLAAGLADDVAGLSRLRRVLLPAAAVFVTGCLRELGSRGTIFGVRLLPWTLTRDLGFGASGVMLAGLVLALFRIRERTAFRCDRRSSVSAGALFALWALAAGILYGLVTAFLPIPELYRPLTAVAAAVLTGLAFAAPAGGQTWGELFRSPTLTALAALALMAADGLADGRWQSLFFPMAAGIAVGIALMAAGALLTGVENIDLPVPFRTAPAVLVAAGTAMLALHVLY